MLGWLLIPASGTSCMYVPYGFPGFNPIRLNWSVMYLTERSSPFVPGARPSNSSDARTLMFASIPSGVITSRAGSKRSASSSAAKSDVPRVKTIPTKQQAIFTQYGDVVPAVVSNGEHMIDAWVTRVCNYRPSWEPPADPL